jgi:hypothetical protein
MKKLLLILSACLPAITASSHAETFFGPGTINIETNETILITTCAGTGLNEWDFNGIRVQMIYVRPDSPYVFAGPGNLSTTNQNVVTFRRLLGSAIKMMVINCGGTNVINVPTGKTIQFFQRIYNNVFDNPVNPDFRIRPQGSTNVYPFGIGYEAPPAFTGPATIEATIDSYFCPNSDSVIVPYFFTDELLQLPSSGFLRTPAPALEVNVEKSYNLTNWVPTAAFNTEAEAGAFYRLRMLK